MIRAIASLALALCLILTGLGAGAAQIRMAAAGGYCGIGAPQILLDAAGLPILDADGQSIAAPDCPACTISLALMTAPALPSRPGTVHPTPIAALPATLVLDDAPRTHPARAPPVVA